jgi:hypothetical protein
MTLINSKMASTRKSAIFLLLELSPMSHATRAAHLADLVDLSLAPVADLREFAQATEAGEGTIHREDAHRHREIRRADL